MSTPLRAFLLLRSDSNEWQIEVARDLERLVQAWKEHSNARPVTGVIHVGFERSPARYFDDLARQYPLRVLLTAAAKHALPRSFHASTAPIGEVEGQAVYLAIRGWGYEIEDITPAHRETASIFIFKDWLGDFITEHPDCAELFTNVGISDDSSYLAAEATLESGMRKKLGLARYRALIKGDESDPCAVARAAPPWLREREFTTLDVRVRIANVFDTNDIRTVADLGQHNLGDLLRMPNFGRTSVTNLLETLNRAMQIGPPDAARRVESICSVGLLQAVRRSLLSLGVRERDILSRRMGLNGTPETLAEIGESYGITRERIRQIEAKSLIRLVTNEVWNVLLTEKLSALLQHREFPLPVLGVEAIDPWFAGVAAASDAFRYILCNMCPNSANFVEIDGIAYFAFLDQQKWDTTLFEARRLLAAGTQEGWTEQHCRSLVHALLPDEATEFRTLLWDKATTLCHFSANDSGVRVLCSYGRGAEQIVEAVLQDAERPLHYSEIFERVRLRSKREIDIRRVHHAAATVGYLLGRGTFGMGKHLPLNSQDLTELADQAEAIVSNGPSDRQWHATELLTTLIETGSRQALAADKYVLDAALRRSGELQSLGRLVWTQPALDGSDQARIDIRQAIVALVRQAGRPLKAGDIRQRLVAVRGLGEHVQIHNYPPLIRVGPSLWGLIDRDLAVTPDKQKEFTDTLAELLYRRGFGLHASELWDVLRPIPELTVEAALSIASLDDRIRISAGQYIYLDEWGEPRRESVPVAVAAVLRSLDAPMSFSGIVSLVQDRVGRFCERSAVSVCLQALGATLDDGLWTFNAVVEGDEDRDMELVV